MIDIKLKKALASSTEVKLLSDQLYKELEIIYGGAIIEKFTEENAQMIVFFVVYDEGKNPIACGALKDFDNNTAEIKRMYVKPEYRGLGISKKILSALEQHARESHYQRLILETGLKQPEAISLYEKYGYKPLKCYGRHANDPDSRCFEKFVY